MGGSIFGQIFRVGTFGESHGPAMGCLIDGCPAGLEISAEEINQELARRRPAQSSLTTSRDESDQIEILSGVFEGKTTGTPILLICHNHDAQSGDYAKLKDLYRPGHADFTWEKKFGQRDYRGGGRASARETVARVAAGAVAQKFLRQQGIEFLSFVETVGDLKAAVDLEQLSRTQIESNALRCPDQKIAQKMQELILNVKAEGDSIGGIIRGIIRGVPAGLGEPVFDKLHAELGKAMLSINAVKGFEIGTGFASAKLRGSENNDEFIPAADGTIKTKTNFCGGVLGGISTGGLIDFRVAFKPVSTIAKTQQTTSVSGTSVEFSGTGRHDPCVLPRAVAIVDSMAALVIVDFVLRSRLSKFNSPLSDAETE